MTIIRRIARPMLASIFLLHGVKRLRSTDQAAKELEPTLQEIAAYIPQAEALTSNTQLTTRVLGGVEVVAASALTIGKLPRLSAATLFWVHALNSYAEHRNATLESEDDIALQRTVLLKNVSLLGGLSIASVDLAGRPSLRWRAERAAQVAKIKSHTFAERTVKWAEDLGEDASKALKTYEKDARKSFRQAEKQAKKAVQKASKTVEKKAGK